MAGKAKTKSAPTEKRDWVGETVQCFIKNASCIDPTDPIKAIARHFAQHASDELKARCKAEGKTAALCWKFIEAVARKALGNRSGHIDPGVVFAIAMHYFEDVPADWDGKTGASTHVPKASEKKPRKPAETPSEVKKEKERAKKAAAKKKAEPSVQQGFFFDLLEETPTDAPEAAKSVPEQEGEVAK